MDIKTVFEVEKENYTVSGTGQSAVATALSEFKGKVVKLVGFIIDNVFHPADLESYWEKSNLRNKNNQHESNQR